MKKSKYAEIYTPASFKGKDKFEKKALATIYRYYHEFRLQKSQNEVKNALTTREIVFLTGSKFQFFAAIFSVILLTYVLVSFIVLLSILPQDVDFEMFYEILGFKLPGLLLLIIFIIMLVILFGFIVCLVIFSIKLKRYFIILDSHGIYYKKLGSPRFLAWTDVSMITANERYSRKNPGVIIEIHLMNPERKVRFKSGNYRRNRWKRREEKLPLKEFLSYSVIDNARFSIIIDMGEK